MPTNLQDEICPDYVGEKVIVIAPVAGLVPKAFNPVDLTIDYTKCTPGGAVLPLELTVLAPTAGNFVRRIFTRLAPTTFSFIPREGGRHLVRIGEVGHNRFWGSLVVDVAGEQAK